MKRKILKEEYNFPESSISIEKLHFWPENPRIYSEVFSFYEENKHEGLNSTQLQEKIFQILKNRDDVRELRRQIEEAGGLTEPLIVRKSLDGNYDVLEGNRRLAACKMIRERSDENSELYNSVSLLMCEVVSEDVKEGVIFSLLGTLHITGKHPWEPFAKACYIKKRLDDTNGDLSLVEKEVGESQKEIQIQVENIKLMKEADESKDSRYSYYDVLNRNRKTQKEIKNSQTNRTRLLNAAKTWSGTAQEFRKDLKDAFDDNKATKKFLKGNKELEEAAEEAREKGSTNVILKRIEGFRKSMSKNKKEIISSIPTTPKLKYEFSKLKRIIEQIDKELEEKESG